MATGPGLSTVDGLPMNQSAATDRIARSRGAPAQPDLVSSWSVVVATHAGAGAREVGAVDVQRDGGRVSDVANPVDVAGGRESAYVAGVVCVRADAVEVPVEQFLVLDTLDDAEGAPADVVVDPGALARTPDQRNDRERPVRLDV